MTVLILMRSRLNATCADNVFGIAGEGRTGYVCKRVLVSFVVGKNVDVYIS